MFRRRIYSSARIKQRRQILVDSAILIAVSAAMLTAWLSWLSHRPDILIAYIAPNGNTSLTDAEIASATEEVISGTYAYLFPRRNIFIAPRNEIKKTLLDAYPAIASLAIPFEDFKTLRLSIEERTPSYLWCGPAETARYGSVASTTSCYFLDREGVVFTKAPHYSAGLFFEFYGAIRGEKIRPESVHKKPIGYRILPRKDFENAIALVHAFEKAGLSPEKFVTGNDDAGTVVLQGSGAVIFEGGQSRDAVLANLISALGAKPFSEIISDKRELGRFVEYIDLRYGNKVFYKLRPQ